MSWILSEPSQGVNVAVNHAGVRLTSATADLTDYASLKDLEPCTRLGRLLPSLIPQLTDMGVGQPDGRSIVIGFDDFVNLEDSEIDAFDDLVPWSPFAVELEAKGFLGQPEFRYKIRLYSGRQQVHADRIGCFMKRAKKVYRLEKQLFKLLDAVEQFNALEPEKKNGSDVLLKFAEIKGIAQDVGADIDRYIFKEKVIVPARIDLDLVEEKDGRISFVPKIDRVPDEELFRVFMETDAEDDVYAVPDREGGRIRVLLDETQKEVFRRMRRVRHLSGSDKAKVLRNPYEVFDGVAAAVTIDLRKFGPRVTGVGDFPFVSIPFIKYEGTGIFGDDTADGAGVKVGKFSAGIDCTYPDGTQEKVYFENRKELLDFHHQAEVAWETGEQTAGFHGKTIVVDKDFLDGVNVLVKRATHQKRRSEESQKDQAYLLIYTNEDELQYHEDEETRDILDGQLPLPQSLVDPSTLKQYQKEGIKWLQLNYLLNEKGGRRGCLLADEMGLGKTFQILALLSWLVERGAVSPPGTIDSEKPPWNPILIVVPLMLLENETWQKDMEKFFKFQGAVFTPYLALHGTELKKRRLPDMKGRETELRQSVLDLDELRRYRVILTSYETVVNYQFSFAMMKDSWTAVVTDEAQEYKTPNTKISHALKSLAPRMRIACTGTPVETKLIDVWNILDFLQPGVLGSAAEFARAYEQPIQEEPARREEILAELKSRLFFGQRHAYVLRRDKQSIIHELPAKHEHKEYCDLTAEQRERHMDFVGQVHTGQHPFAILPQLMKLYQHPDLIPLYKGLRESEVEGALERSPKLRKVLEILANVRLQREKALVFTCSLNMQQLLSTAISARFGLRPDIVNGAMPRSGSGSGVKTRKEAISRFCTSEGFNILIVSPDVAGVGLTLVEANHVIHYGRWWNPAKESQATDRVYRIGQQKDVHVYYPIAKDPDGAFVSFDERLDSLLDRRKDLARDFLAPMPGDADNQQELIKDLMGEEPTVTSTPLSETDVAELPWDRFEALVALIEEKSGHNVVLTPKSGDFGVDVVSINGREISLIQCKHSVWGSSCDDEVIPEIVNAFDNYRGRWLKQLRDVTLRPILITNGKLTRAAVKQAKEREIEYLDNRRLLNLINKRPCSLAEVEVMEGRRKASMKDVEVEIGNLLRGT